MTTQQTPSVTQADRDAAESLMSVWGYGHGAMRIRKGEADSEASVQAFARHREAAEASSRAREDALREAVERHLKWLNNLPIPTTGCTAQMMELRAALAASNGGEG